jgi:hypothetical protein
MDSVPEIIEFRSETAAEVVDLLFELLATCRDNPKAPCRDWSNKHGVPLVDELIDRRAELAHQRKGWIYTSVEAFEEIAKKLAPPE